MLLLSFGFHGDVDITLVTFICIVFIQLILNPLFFYCCNCLICIASLFCMRCFYVCTDLQKNSHWLKQVITVSVIIREKIFKTFRGLLFKLACIKITLFNLFCIELYANLQGLFNDFRGLICPEPLHIFSMVIMC